MNIFDTLIVQPIFNLLLWFYSIFGDFGVAVILFTLLVRFAMWPLVVRQLHQAKAMRKLQPELAKIRKQTKDKQVQGMQMLELYKKHDVKPFRMFLMLLIQLPIFIALFSVIRIFTSHRDQIEAFTYGFMKNIPEIQALVLDPESFNHFFLGVIDLTLTPFSSEGPQFYLILFAIIAAVTQYFMAKQTSPQSSNGKRLRDVLAEAGNGKEPDQAELNAVMMGKMTKFLPFMMFFIMLTLPGGVILYYMTSNLFAVTQQHFLLRRDEEELEAIAAESEPAKQTGKKATAKARAKQAREADTTNVTRITAKDSQRK